MGDVHKIQKAQAGLIKLIKLRFQDVSQDIIQKVTSIHNISTIEYLFAKVTVAKTLDEIDWEDLNLNLNMEVSMEDALSEQYQIQMKQEKVLKLIKTLFHDVSPDIIERVTSIHSISTLDKLSGRVFIAHSRDQTLEEIDWEDFRSEFPKFAYILEK